MALLLVPFFLTGCTHRPSSNQASSGGESNTLTIWRLEGDEKIFEQIVNSFKEQNPNLKVNYRTFSPTDDYEKTVLNALATGEGPDIWEIRNDELPRHKDKLTGTELTAEQFESLKKNYARSIAQEMVSGNKLYGMPIGIDPLVLFVNTEHFSQVGLEEFPRTWADIFNAIQKLTLKAEGLVLRPGLALGTAANIDRASQIVELLMLQFQTQMVDPAHRTATFDLYTQQTDTGAFAFPGKDAMRFFASFANPEAPYQSWDSTQAYSNQAFLQGNLSMMINYISLVPQLRKLDDKLPFTVGPVPQIEQKKIPVEDFPAYISEPVHVAKYRSLVVSKPSIRLSANQQKTQTDLAWQFILFATTNPAITIAYSDATGLVPPQRNFDESTSTTFGVKVATKVNAYLSTWYKGPNPRTVDKIMYALTRGVADEKRNIDETFSQASQAITGILQ